MTPARFLLLGGLLAGLVFPHLAARAAELSATEPTAFDRPATPLSYELTFGHLPWKTSGPFTGWTKNFRKNPIPYRMEVTEITWARPLGSTKPILRNVDFLRSVVWSSITRGPENHWTGGALGFRYNAPWAILPRTRFFASYQGGIGGIDASGQHYAQAKDLTFTYLAAMGVRTRLGESLALSVQVLGMHISNGWQTRPSEGIDCAGWSLAVAYRPRR